MKSSGSCSTEIWRRGPAARAAAGRNTPAVPAPASGRGAPRDRFAAPVVNRSGAILLRWTPIPRVFTLRRYDPGSGRHAAALLPSKMMRQRKSPAARTAGRVVRDGAGAYECARIARRGRAMMLVILIAGFTAGPAVSL